MPGRRAVVRSALALGALSLAGCAGRESTAEPTATTPTSTATHTRSTATPDPETTPLSSSTSTTTERTPPPTGSADQPQLYLANNVEETVEVTIRVEPEGDEPPTERTWAIESGDSHRVETFPPLENRATVTVYVPSREETTYEWTGGDVTLYVSVRPSEIDIGTLLT